MGIESLPLPLRKHTSLVFEKCIIGLVGESIDTRHLCGSLTVSGKLNNHSYINYGRPMMQSEVIYGCVRGHLIKPMAGRPAVPVSYIAFGTRCGDHFCPHCPLIAACWKELQERSQYNNLMWSAIWTFFTFHLGFVSTVTIGLFRRPLLGQYRI